MLNKLRSNCIGVEVISKGLLIYGKRIKLEYTLSASKCYQQVNTFTSDFEAKAVETAVHIITFWKLPKAKKFNLTPKVKN